MENDFQFQLIDGEFTPAGAAKVLFPLINNKISVKNLFGNTEKNGNNKSYSGNNH